MVGQELPTCVWPAHSTSCGWRMGSHPDSGDGTTFKSSRNEEGPRSRLFSLRVKGSRSFCRAVQPLTMSTPREVWGSSAFRWREEVVSPHGLPPDCQTRGGSSLGRQHHLVVPPHMAALH